MNHWLKIVSIVELDPQPMLTVRLPILSKRLFIMMSCEHLGPWASCYLTHFSDVKEYERINNKHYWYFHKVCNFGYQRENKKYFKNTI